MEVPNMPITKYPNRDALRNAIDIYLDALRPFIVKHLNQVPGETAEVLVDAVLKTNKEADKFWQQREATEDVESAIDFPHVPHIIKNYWNEVFSKKFKGDNTVQNILWLIYGARNACEHRAKDDLDPEYVRTHLFLIAYLLEKIQRPTDKHDVETIRDQLFADDTPQRLTEAQRNLTRLESENTELQKSFRIAETNQLRLEQKLEKAKADASSYKKRFDVESKRLQAAETEKKDYKRRFENISKKLETLTAEKKATEKDLKAQLKEAKQARPTPTSDQNLNPEPAPNTEASAPKAKGNPIKQLAREMDTSPKKIKKALKALYRNDSPKKIKKLTGLKVAHLKQSPSYAKAWKRYKTKHT